MNKPQQVLVLILYWNYTMIKHVGLRDTEIDRVTEIFIILYHKLLLINHFRRSNQEPHVWFRLVSSNLKKILRQHHDLRFKLGPMVQVQGTCPRRACPDVCQKRWRVCLLQSDRRGNVSRPGEDLYLTGYTKIIKIMTSTCDGEKNV